jgi:hypothetical protein
VQNVVMMDDTHQVMHVVFEQVGKRLLDPNLSRLERA